MARRFPALQSLPSISAAFDIVVIAAGLVWAGAAVGAPDRYLGWFTVPFREAAPCEHAPLLSFQVRPRPDVDEAAFRRALVRACPGIVEELARIPAYDVSHPPTWVGRLDWDGIEARLSKLEGLDTFADEVRVVGTMCWTPTSCPAPPGRAVNPRSSSVNVRGTNRHRAHSAGLHLRLAINSRACTRRWSSPARHCWP